MTNRESLEMQLQYAVEKYGENAPVTLGIKRQLREMQQDQGPQMLCFQAGFRKAKASKRPKA